MVYEIGWGQGYGIGRRGYPPPPAQNEEKIANKNPQKKLGNPQVSCSSLSNDSVPSALLQADVLSDYAL